MTSSLLSSLASLPPSLRAEALAALSDADADAILHDWPLLARPEQLAPPGSWLGWLFLAGRGAGKTRAGAEWVRAQARAGCGRLGMIAPTAADARDVMVEGDSGLLSVCWAKDRDHRGAEMGRPVYEPSKRRITWANGAQVAVFSAEEADRLRGPQHDALWCDELAAWKAAQDAWDMAMFGLRLGDHPRVMVTTTPKPITIIRALVKDPAFVVSRGKTYDNAANLAPSFLAAIRERYEGTRLGRQEIAAEILDDVPGALWTDAMIDRTRPVPTTLRRVVVGVDPSGAGSADDGSDSIGIVVAAMGDDGRYYVLEDATCNLGPAGWARRVIEMYRKHQADRIVAERNFGGGMVEAVIRTADPRASVRMVTASRGKALRAEPVAALYEQGRVTHVPGLAEVEDQMMHMTLSGYVGDGSPDRLDALVWAMTDLGVARQKRSETATVSGMF